jgi:tRNA modification GTPase
MEETIAAIATPPGEGGIGIIRISGDGALPVAEKIFQPKNKTRWATKKSHQLYLGNIVRKEPTEVVLDEVLLSIMRGPKSFTGEDVVEINCHGGYLPLKLILELILEQGVRLADPGEFSKRAFLNGRLDLTQAEAIIDVIRAKTERGLDVAINHLEGKLKEIIADLSSNLLKILAYLEASIDFPDDEIDAMDQQEIEETIQKSLQEINKMLQGFNTGKIYREGLKTIIVGKPNVGKSSLLNALLKENRAIVTDIPGTTRDIIEEYINIGGIPVRIIDTAGIRSTEDVVEKIGVEKTIELVQKADLVLIVIDAETGLTAEDAQVIDIVNKADKNYLLLLNKIDLTDEVYFVKDKDILQISAKYETGIEQLEKAIKELVGSGQVTSATNQLITKERHYEALHRAKAHLEETITALQNGVSADFLTIDLKGALQALGEISGQTTGEDILDQIFKDFCIGK